MQKEEETSLSKTILLAVSNGEMDKNYYENLSKKYLVKDEFFKSMEQFLICQCCQECFRQPYICLECQNTICRKCLKEKYKLKCPNKCSGELKPDKNKENLLDNLTYVCKKGCGEIFKRKNLNIHLQGCNAVGKKKPLIKRLFTHDTEIIRDKGKEIPTKRIILLGAKDVGKTSLLRTFVDGTPQCENVTTIGFQIYCVNYLLSDGSAANFQIIDTGGEEKFKAITSNYIRDADGIILMYDITRYETFPTYETYYINMVNEYYSNRLPPIIVVGNKTDLEEKRQISIDIGIKYARDNMFLFKETSAKKNNNVRNVFEELFELINYETKNKQNESKTRDSIFLTYSETEKKRHRCCSSKGEKTENIN